MSTKHYEVILVGKRFGYEDFYKKVAEHASTGFFDEVPDEVAESMSYEDRLDYLKGDNACEPFEDYSLRKLATRNNKSLRDKQEIIILEDGMCGEYVYVGVALCIQEAELEPESLDIEVNKIKQARTKAFNFINDRLGLSDIKKKELKLSVVHHYT